MDAERRPTARFDAVTSPVADLGGSVLPGTLPFTLRQLQVFVAVAEAGSISSAARKLYISQTAVSMAVTELEKALDAKLMIRRRAHGIQLTPTGQSIIPLGRALLAQAGELYGEATGPGILRGTVSVGCFPSLGPSLMPLLIHEFLTSHPEAKISFSEDQAERLEQGVLSGSLDMMITYDIGLRSNLEKITLRSHQLGVLLAEEHRMARGAGPLDVSALGSEPFVMLDSPLSVQHAESFFHSAGISPEIRYRSQNFETVRSLVGRGFGWSLVLQRPATGLTHEGRSVVVREIGNPLPEAVPVVIAWAKAVPLSRTARAFIELSLSRDLSE